MIQQTDIGTSPINSKFFNKTIHINVPSSKVWDALKMPLSVQGHHAVMDGIHMGRFYETVQDYLHHPEVVLGAV